ncbi:MAG: hypothetical protein ACRD52_03175 [Candidatus Acidiferrales bacterium]
MVLVGGVYLWFFGVQTTCALTVRYFCRKMPDVAKIPLPLSDLSISKVPHRTVSYFGYEFELPWDDVDEKKDKTVGTIHISYSRSGNAFWFSTFPPKEFANYVMKATKLDPQGFRQMFGNDAFESDYGFHQKMLQLTPSKITPFVSRRQAVAGQMLLMIKAISMPKADSGIFSIHSPSFEGFQFENPQARPSRITEELYSNDGGIDVMFIQKVEGSVPTISQSEINRVIQSIRKIPVPTVASNEAAKSR